MIHLDPADRAMIKTLRERMEEHLRNSAGCRGCPDYIKAKADLDATIQSAVNGMFEKVGQ